MYTEICAELGEAIAAASSAPYIQFVLILRLPFRNSKPTMATSGALVGRIYGRRDNEKAHFPDCVAPNRFKSFTAVRFSDESNGK
jgi:hypothetical protein